MRSISLISGCSLLMMLMLGGATAGESWVDLGELHFPKKGLIGKLAVNRESLRRRNHHYEIWERITFIAPAGQSAAPEDMAERLTLWAIRCRRGAMAKVTERVAGSFSPRSESLSFHFPSPASAGAEVVEIACGEARRRFAEGRSARDRSKGAADTPSDLERPPAMLDEDPDNDDE